MVRRSSSCVAFVVAMMGLLLPFVFAQTAIPGSTQNQPVPGQNDSSSHVSQSQALPTAAPAFHFWSNPDPNAQVTVKEDTLFRVMTDQPLSTRQTHAGVALLFTLSEDVVANDLLIVPRGATVHGTVVEARQTGALTGTPDLILKLTSLDLGGQSYPLYTYQFKVTGTSKTKPTETKMKGGAVIGGIVGGVFSGSAKGDTTAVGKLAGIGTGAALGAGVGAAVSTVTPGPILSIPAESTMDFYLSSPISVVPATEKEAKRLSEGLHRGGPVLYVRGETP